MSGNRAVEGVGTRVTRVHLVDQVIAGLRAALASGIYAPGDRLPGETRLAETYGVARSTVREALKVLRHLGLVETAKGSGTRVVAEPSTAPAVKAGIDDLRRLFEVRSTVEIEVARLAALRRTSRQLTQIHAAIARLHDSAGHNDRIALGRADIDFHRTVAVASGNAYFVEIYGSFGERFGYAAGRLLDMQAPEWIRDLHDDLVQAIEAQDARAAVAAARGTFDEVTIRLNLLAGRQEERQR